MNLSQLEHPFVQSIQQYLHDLPVAASTTGLNRSDYLQVIGGIIRFFHTLQDPSGPILDPYVGREIAYSTPCYALGAALLVSNGETELIDSACRAMLHSCRVLADGQAPDNHPDFFTIFLVATDRLLAPLVSIGVRDEWRDHLRRIDPYLVYRFQVGKVPDEQIHNWNAINLTGEYLRYQAGLGGDPLWWQTHLPYHLPRFNEFGLYRDGLQTGTSHPLAYDAVTRYMFSALLEGGYNEEFAAQLRETLVKGALTALFVQSPVGEWPGVGRSAQHTWNDAALAAAYEWAAVALKTDEPRLAAACKRGAHLALQAIQPFIRPSGDLWIVRNRFDPAERHGFEEYSVHTSDNLWTAAALTFACQFADDNIAEAPLPSECSAYALDLGPDFHQVVAAKDGLYVQIETSGDPATNPTGMLRVNWAGANPQIGPSEGCVAAPRYSVLGPKNALTYAPAWQDRLGGWHSLAAYGADGSFLSLRGQLEQVERQDGELTFQVAWQGKLDGASRISARYSLEGNTVRVVYQAEGPLLALRAELPVMRFDGELSSQVQTGESDLTVNFRGSQLQISLLTPGHRLVDSRQAFATRTGVLHRWVTEGPGLAVEFSLTLT